MNIQVSQKYLLLELFFINLVAKFKIKALDHLFNGLFFKYHRINFQEQLVSNDLRNLRKQKNLDRLK